MSRFSPPLRLAAALAAAVLVAGPAPAQQRVYVTSQIEGKTPDQQRDFTQELKDSKLSPEMHAVVALNGEFRGFDTLAVAGVGGGNPFRAVITTNPAGGVVPAAANANPFFKSAPAAGEVVGAAAAEEPPLQVSYKAGQEIAEAELAAAGFEILKLDGKPRVTDFDKQGGVIIVRPANGRTDKAKVEALLKIKGLKFVSPIYPVARLDVPQPAAQQANVPVNAVASGPLEPNDPAFKQTVPGFPQVNLWGMKNINAPKAWGRITDASGIIVAVIDSGIDAGHVDLADNMFPNTPFGGINTSADSNHGTHCAGTVGGVGNNGRGVAGVCWKVRILNIGLLRSGVNLAPSECVKHAVSKGAAVLSNSWTSFGNQDFALRDAIEDAKDKNVIFVAAAANENKDNDLTPHFPSSYPNTNIIAVGAIDQNEGKASFSNWGKTTVDLFAPGVGIWSCGFGNTLNEKAGTSMACPHVAGACALVWAAKGRDTEWTVIRSFILDNARKVPGLETRCVTGATLDIGKLGDDGTPPPVTPPPVMPPPPASGPAAGALLGSVTFTEADNVAPADGVLKSVKITMTKKTTVQVAASFDVKGGDAFTVSVGTGASAWAGGSRNTGGAADKWTATALHAVKELDAGEHTIQVLTTAGSGAKFGSGTITVTGFSGAATTDAPPTAVTPAATAAPKPKKK